MAAPPSESPRVGTDLAGRIDDLVDEMQELRVKLGGAADP